MIQDLIIIDDFLENPDELLFKSRCIEYYDVDSDPGNIPGQEVYYPGYRSLNLQKFDINLYSYLTKRIMNQTLDRGVGLYRNNYSFTSFGRMYFHYTTEDYVVDERWLHQDPTLFAGIIYLHKNPPKDTGTIIIKDGKEIIVENKYNRLVLYRSDFMHSIQKSFGKTIYDSRLTLTIFFDMISLEILYNNKKFIESQEACQN